VTNAANRIYTVVIDLDGTDQLDITSADQLSRLAEGLSRRQVNLVLAHVHLPSLNLARSAGLLEKIGDDRIFPNLDQAVTWASKQVAAD
jgi:MFS superfamily sulfate permease-like transporter